MALRYDLLEPGLALSGMPASASELNTCPFRAILNLCDFQMPRYARGLRPDIEFVRRPTNDVYPVPRPYLYLAALELAHLRCLGKTTLVHCHAGRSRSPSVVALYWMGRDNLCWNEALDRIRLHREGVEPNRFLATDQSHLVIADHVRRFLGGEEILLEAARLKRQELILSLQQRKPNPVSADHGWSLLDDGFAMGSTTARWDSLSEYGIREVIFVGDAVEDELSSKAIKPMRFTKYQLACDDISSFEKLTQIVNDLESRRCSGRNVCLVSSGDEFAGALVACTYLIVHRDMDIGSAIWYVGSRRSTIWTHVDKLWSRGGRKVIPGVS